MMLQKEALLNAQCHRAPGKQNTILFHLQLSDDKSQFQIPNKNSSIQKTGQE